MEEYTNLVLQSVRIRPMAQMPRKVSDTSSLIEISVCARPDSRAEDDISRSNSFATGFFFQIPPGHSLIISPTPNLVKCGYSLMSPTIIDSGSREELILDLFKFEQKDDLELPFHVANAFFVKEVPHHIGVLTLKETSYDPYAQSQDVYSTSSLYNTKTQPQKSLKSQKPGFF